MVLLVACGGSGGSTPDGTVDTVDAAHTVTVSAWSSNAAPTEVTWKYLG
jgi:hypothetical protein